MKSSNYPQTSSWLVNSGCYDYFLLPGVRSYLPFSAGRRGCLDESLAKTELFLIASRLQHQTENPPGKLLPDLTGGPCGRCFNAWTPKFVSKREFEHRT